jgi:hypothetical protein
MKTPVRAKALKTVALLDGLMGKGRSRAAQGNHHRINKHNDANEIDS